MSEDRIIVVGLSDIGVPLAVELARKFEVIGIDSDIQRVEQLKSAYDRTGEVSRDDLIGTKASWESDLSGIRGTFYIVAVTTPANNSDDPDLSLLDWATRWIGSRLKRADLVCYESEVYHSIVEERCLPILLEESRLRRKDICLGSSRSQDESKAKKLTIRDTTKIISADSHESMDRIAFVYSTVAPLLEAKSDGQHWWM